MRLRAAAPAIVAVATVVGAHPFCHLMFRCGCGLVSLSAHCNIHRPAPPHCPWCAQPAWFALAGLLALVGATLLMRLIARRSPSLWAQVVAGLAGAVAGGAIGALVTRLASA
jgi:hypothetical protein